MLAVTAEVVGDLVSGISATALLSAVDSLIRRYPIKGFVTASGFEDRPGLLAELALRRPVFGNDAAAVGGCKDPLQLQAAAEAAGIPMPETRIDRPPQLAGWLSKQRGGAGGLHVQLAEVGSNHSADRYWQRRVVGDDFSLTFLACKGHVVPLGFNRCWSAPAASAPFRYGGAVRIDVDDLSCAPAVVAAAWALTRAFDLRGLCGLDFKMASPGQWYLLDLNPRPTATFELHESAGGRFLEHVASCRTAPCNPAPSAYTGSAGHTVVYMGNDVTIAAAEIAEWVTDIPTVGRHLSAGAPLCMVHARGPTRAATQSLLAARAKAVVDQLQYRSAPKP